MYSTLRHPGFAAIVGASSLAHFILPKEKWKCGSVFTSHSSRCEEKERVFRKSEVAEHNTVEKRVWVSLKDNVYDITDFINNHPGGRDKIMLAAGCPVDPFWRIYQQHENRGNALKLLEPMKIGKLDPSDVEKALDSDDPYFKEPTRHPGLIFHNTKPMNAEVPVALLQDHWITPNDIWFIRHHHPVPVIDGDQYRMEVTGSGSPITLSLEDLKKRFPKHEVVTTVQCGGNRRSGFNYIQSTSGISWGPGAISTAKFGGVLLRDVLRYTGLVTPESADADGLKHVIFEGFDEMQASIPIEKALSPYGECLLAYEMNGEELPREHGYPVRTVVPGHVGVRNVKWVRNVLVSKEEATGPWQRGIAYKGFNPSVRSFSSFSAEDIENVQSMQEQPVNSIIASPVEGTTTELDTVAIRGYAYSGGGRGIVRVDVSIDGGENWISADLKEGSEQHPSKAWAWTFWEADVDIPEHQQGKEITVMCKATDIAYNVQPENPESIWNIRGLNNTAWHRVTIRHVI